MKLYGSTTSPYVRRVRLFLADQSFQFINIDIFSAAGRQQLIAKNPTLKVPFIVDDEQYIYDSRVIYRYLCEKNSTISLSWQQENLLTLIDAANDSFISLLLSQRSGLDTDQDLLFFNLQNERVAITLTQLDLAVSEGHFEQWSYLAISLYCLLDWVVFRQLYRLDKFEHLTKFIHDSKNQPHVKLTDPRC